MPVESDPLLTGGLGAALGATGLYVAKALYELAKNAGGASSRGSNFSRLPRKPETITVQQHEDLLKIYREIEHSKEDRADMLSILREIKPLVGELHEWHDARDEDGALKWWNKGSVERSIKRIEAKVDRIEEKLRTKSTGRSGEYRFKPEKKD